MNAIDKATQSQIANLQERSGKSLEELFSILRTSGLEKHGELRDLMKREHGMGHGDANTLVHLYRQSLTATDTASAGDDPLDVIYEGKKAPLRPLHVAVMKVVEPLGDFEIAPKKSYVSLRRKKQFATVGPGTKGRLEIGLNMKGVEPTQRLEALPPGGMCQYRLFVTSPEEVDGELLAWIRTAFESAGRIADGMRGSDRPIR